MTTGADGLALRFECGARDEEELEVVALEGSEEVSRPFAFKVSLSEAIERAAAFEQDLLGEPARVVIRSPEGARTVRGVIRAVRVSNSHRRGGRVVCEARLAPRLWLLGRTRNTRIFQEKTMPEVVSAVLDAHGVRHRWALARRYVPRDYCVQHQESDLHFVRRLLAEDGVFFYFAHPGADAPLADEEELVLADVATAYAPIAGATAVPFRDRNRMDAAAEHVAAFSVAGRVRPGAVKLREFQFERPSTFLSGDAEIAVLPGVATVEPALRVYDHHAEYEHDDINNPASRVQLEQHRARRVEAEGRGACPRLAPGHWFKLVDSGVESHDQMYAVTRVEHRATVPEVDGAEALSAAREVAYENAFRAVPRGVPYRPPVVRRRVLQAMETATVVGPAGEEIYTDPYGRIKVQFHWDLDGANDERSSCWIRPMQTWGGHGWGFQFLPRVGMEVLVQFVGGDPDRPMVIGSVYNGEHAPPYPLPDLKTRSGIKSRSSPHAEGYNELSFEDMAGHEVVYLHAQRDLDETVRRNHTTAVHNDQLNHVGANHTEKVGVDQSLEVGAQRKVLVRGSESHIVRGDLSAEVGRKLTTKVSGNCRLDVTGDHAVAVASNQRTRVAKNCTLETVGNYACVVGGDHRVDVRGRSVTSVEQDASSTVRGDYALVVKGAYAVASGGGGTTRAAGSLGMAATETIDLTGEKGVTLRCGESVIQVSREEIKITSKRLLFKATEEAVVRGASTSALKLTGDAELIGVGAKVRSSGASLALDQQAVLKGAMVKLGSGAGASTSDAAKGDPAKRKEKEWVFQLFEAKGGPDGGRKPLANKPFTATGHGPDAFEGATDGAGTARIPVVFGRCTVRVEAEGRVFMMDAGALEEMPEKQRALHRLNSLGFGRGEVDSWDQEEKAAALRAFQEANGLPTTAVLDGATLAKLGA